MKKKKSCAMPLKKSLLTNIQSGGNNKALFDLFKKYIRKFYREVLFPDVFKKDLAEKFIHLQEIFIKKAILATNILHHMSFGEFNAEYMLSTEPLIKPPFSEFAKEENLAMLGFFSKILDERNRDHIKSG